MPEKTKYDAPPSVSKMQKWPNTANGFRDLQVLYRDIRVRGFQIYAIPINFRLQLIPIKICILQGTPCDTGFSYTLYGVTICSELSWKFLATRKDYWSKSAFILLDFVFCHNSTSSPIYYLGWTLVPKTDHLWLGEGNVNVFYGWSPISKYY